MTAYSPGTHIIATFTSLEKHHICDHRHFQQLVDRLIEEHKLEKLGEVYHDFMPAGFTGVVCLSESHLSVHTWPEHGKVNVDIYLSNHLRNNDGTVQQLYDALKQHFDAVVEQEQILKR